MEAIVSSLLDQMTSGLSASNGKIVAVSCVESPSTMIKSSVDTAIESTKMGIHSISSTSAVAIKLSSIALVAEMVAEANVAMPAGALPAAMPAEPDQTPQARPPLGPPLDTDAIIAPDEDMFSDNVPDQE